MTTLFHTTLGVPLSIVLPISTRVIFEAKRMSTFTKFGLFPTLQDTLFALNKSELNGPVTELLQIYNDTKTKYENCIGNKKHPLIVLEGLDGCGKTTLGKALSLKLCAKIHSTPPKSIKHLRLYFDENLSLRSAFYSLGNYIAALEVSHILNFYPVVMDRFWHSTIAFAIGQGIRDKPEVLAMPDKSDNIFEWPSDLLKPDKVILLVVSEEERLRRQSSRTTITEQELLLKKEVSFRENVILAYTSMKEPTVTQINADESFKKTLYLLKNECTNLIQ